MIRTPQWVYFKRFNRVGAPELANELYDAINDRTEAYDLAADNKYAETITHLDWKIDNYFHQYSTECADLWKGGKPIQNSMLQNYWRSIWGETWQPVYSYTE